MLCWELKDHLFEPPDSCQAAGEDTVTADEEDDEVDAHHHVGEDRAAVRHDAVVHDGVPVFSGEDLQGERGQILRFFQWFSNKFLY